MDKLGFLFKTLPEKGLARKSIGCKGGKKSKKIYTAAFFCSSRWFKNLRNHCNLGQTFRTN